MTIKIILGSLLVLAFMCWSLAAYPTGYIDRLNLSTMALLVFLVIRMVISNPSEEITSFVSLLTSKSNKDIEPKHPTKRDWLLLGLVAPLSVGFAYMLIVLKLDIGVILDNIPLIFPIIVWGLYVQYEVKIRKNPNN